MATVKENALLGYITMPAAEVIRLGEAQIAWILEKRKEWEVKTARLKAEHIAAYRKWRWNRWFNSKLSDEELWREVNPCMSDLYSNTTSEFRDAQCNADCAYDNMLQNCKRLVALAKASPDGIVHITDQGYQSIR